ncbi:MAG: hypothetical protein ACOYIP_03510 [Coriobacteriales bacterium]|jgi:hypothetical protein
MRQRPAVWAVRAAFLIVFIINVQCAVQFICWPDSFVGAYELSGVAGKVAVQGLGIAFLMWNCTYPAVIISPTRFRALGVVVLAQQAVGLVGELLLSASLPAGHDILQASISRFAAFDGAGLVIMLAAFVWMAVSLRRTPGSPTAR